MDTNKELRFFCENLHRLRMAHGLSKTKMTAILGISVKTLTLVESGIVPSRLGSSVLLRIHRYFGIKPHQLFRPPANE